MAAASTTHVSAQLQDQQSKEKIRRELRGGWQREAGREAGDESEEMTTMAAPRTTVCSCGCMTSRMLVDVRQLGGGCSVATVEVVEASGDAYERQIWGGREAAGDKGARRVRS